MRLALLLTVLMLAACVHKPPPPELDWSGRVDVIVVPGCPSLDDGRVSPCQWERAAWAAVLWERGLTRRFVTSGAAVQNRYVEAEALSLAMQVLGVPEAVILTETQALHSDQNAAYSLRLARLTGARRLGIASHRGQALGIQLQMRGWGESVHTFPLDEDAIRSRLATRPDMRTVPVPAEGWLPLKERERQLARQQGRRFRRPHSVFVYAWSAVASQFAVRQPPRPPGPEPTLVRGGGEGGSSVGVWEPPPRR